MPDSWYAVDPSHGMHDLATIRGALPELIAEVRRLRAELGWARECMTSSVLCRFERHHVGCQCWNDE